MNFTQIYNGMVGRDFIKAFNDNFIIADTNLVDILAKMIYKINSTDIKEFKVIDNVVSYTLEEAPTEGEDTREWIPVDITKWGNINGNLEDQEDLWNILEDKAAVDTVEELSNILSTLNTEFTNVRNQVETNTTNIRTNTNDIADLLEAMTEKVNSTNIKAIRLNNAVFQWSPDGRTWYEQPATTSIAWGHLTGDITTQEDLMAYFNNIQIQFSELDDTITAINGTMATLREDLDTLTGSFNTHLGDFDNYKGEVTNSLANIRNIADGASSTAVGVAADLQTHLEDYDNPHHISKATINLENVDNTADNAKPVSVPQRTYINAQIEEVKREISDKSGLINAEGVANSLFVGNQDTYNTIASKAGILAFIVPNEFITATVILNSTNYETFSLFINGVEQTPSSQATGQKVYTGIEYGAKNPVVKVEVNSVMKSYNINLAYNRTNEILVDDLVEGENE